MLLEFFSNADSGILDRKVIACGPVLERGFFHPDKHGPVRPVVSKRVVDDIHHDLLQVQRVSNHPVVQQAGFLQLQVDSTLSGQGGENRDAVLHGGAEVQRCFNRRRPPAFQPAYLKNVVYKGQQMLC